MGQRSRNSERLPSATLRFGWPPNRPGNADQYQQWLAGFGSTIGSQLDRRRPNRRITTTLSLEKLASGGISRWPVFVAFNYWPSYSSSPSDGPPRMAAITDA